MWRGTGLGLRRELGESPRGATVVAKGASGSRDSLVLGTKAKPGIQEEALDAKSPVPHPPLGVGAGRPWDDGRGYACCCVSGIGSCKKGPGGSGSHHRHLLSHSGSKIKVLVGSFPSLSLVCESPPSHFAPVAFPLCACRRGPDFLSSCGHCLLD